ncbi:Cell division protein FtsW [uncultured Eubacterium sp.]|uniref:putative lipid II flippase FtsW n=1 Tax=Brotomerdimonas butyrica TaxID=2981721 RepID=UPI00082130EB|nr:putative lipid II flippase FtsW [Brotomerdimonas butyrica]MCU6755984.1 putative lipid II flippase FtsW [Brotomerdimonas butyrica]SCH59747.1 Cell division protein FtsW [uncultured Eubacterium sp.]
MERADNKLKGKKRTKLKLKSGDFWLMLFTLMLVLFGLIMVFSASYYSSISQDGNPYSYLVRHGAWVVFGLVAMAFGALFDYRKYKKCALPILIVSVILLVLVLTPLGQTTNGATRWIKVGPVTIMPGEIAKIAAIIFVAWFLSEDASRIKSLKRGILPLLGIIAVYGALIVKQPNLSTAITVCGIIIAMMLVAGLKWRYVATAGGIGVVGILSIVIFMKDTYWYNRLTSFTDPFQDALGDGYQAVQSLLALGSGGLFGVGLGKSVQKNLYLPEPQNDFILAIIGEELGYIGVLLLIALYCLFIWRGIHIALNAPDQFGLLLASGIVLMVAIQVILNIAVVTSSMPPTGINLPFISYGGNALLIFMFSAGVLLNISRHGLKVQE